MGQRIWTLGTIISLLKLKKLTFGKKKKLKKVTHNSDHPKKGTPNVHTELKCCFPDKKK